MSGFWVDYPKIETELAEVMIRLRGGPKTGFSAFDETLKTLFQQEGKLLRPALVCIASYLGDPALRDSQREKLIALAASLETLHMATLVHDDIVDEAKLRRGAPTIQSAYGKDYAVYLGDFLLSRSLLMMAEYSLPADTLIKMARAIQSVCMSEIRQFESRYFFDLSMKHYLRIISGKTAALFAASLAAGAHVVDAPEKEVKEVARVGYAIGMCFQIQDDLLDVESESRLLKKDTLSDLEQGYMTLPILLGLRNDTNGELRKLLECGSLNKLLIVQKLHETGAIAKAHDYVQRYANRAAKHMANLPHGETRQMLTSLIPKILGRVN